MSTDYSWRFNHCRCCGKYAEVVMFSTGLVFAAYRHQLMNPAHPDWGYDHRSPFDRPVLSVADWRQVVADFPGELWDEYGHRHEEDPAVFLRDVRPGLDARQTYADTAHFFFDPEGFPMHYESERDNYVVDPAGDGRPWTPEPRPAPGRGLRRLFSRRETG